MVYYNFLKALMSFETFWLLSGSTLHGEISLCTKNGSYPLVINVSCDLYYYVTWMKIYTRNVLVLPVNDALSQLCRFF